jgi:hypothetical protein
MLAGLIRRRATNPFACQGVSPRYLGQAGKQIGLGPLWVPVSALDN